MGGACHSGTYGVLVTAVARLYAFSLTKARVPCLGLERAIPLCNDVVDDRVAGAGNGGNC